MDRYFKYPLNKAYFYQRQADKQEESGQFEAALESRNTSLINLNEVLKTVTCPIVRKTIKFHIKYENRKIELLRIKSIHIKKLVKTLENHSLKMAKAKSHSLHLAIPSVDSVGPRNLSPEGIYARLVEYSFKFLQNTEKIDSIVDEVRSALRKCGGHRSETETDVPKPAILDIPENKEGQHITCMCMKDVLPSVDALKEHNMQNMRLMKNFEKELTLLRSENSKLKAKIQQLESQSEMKNEMKGRQPMSDSSTSPFIVYPAGHECMSPDISLPDFPPLECPPLDFLLKMDQKAEKVTSAMT